MYGQSTSSIPSQNASRSSNNGGGDASTFECNICFDLAQEPVVTLCGHLYCWPCLYKWLHFHSTSGDCPACKAVVQEEKLVPLYGRGKDSTDPRSKSVPGMDIPTRPTGQRPETARPPENNQFNHGFGFMGAGGWGGIPPQATARFGNFALSASFGGLIPYLFNFRMHGFPDQPTYGAGVGYHPYGFANTFHGPHPHAHHLHRIQRQQENFLKMLFLVIIMFLLLTFLSAHLA